MFKPKTDSQIVLQKKVNTLDDTHDDFSKKFLEDKKLIPELEEKIKQLKDKKNTKGLDISQKLLYVDEIKSLTNQLRKCKTRHNDYLLNNSKYIFTYFEDKKNVSMGKTKTKILNDFFKIENEDDKIINKNNDLLQKYMQNVDPMSLNFNAYINVQDICIKCNKGELIYIENEGMSVCNVCGKFVRVITDNEKPSYKEPPKEVCYYVYKRINHFKEILAQFQAKESTNISDEIMNNIKNQIKKERITLSELTNEKTKEILKKLGYSNFYEHISFIKEKLGIKPPIMTPELEEKLCNLFLQIQAPYSKYCPKDRVNFLNYYYTIYKLCELLNHHEFLPHFPMLKDRDKRIEQDEIWKNICIELKWKFIPTL
tara:strand:+ start:6205 stop:7314 length:1110 start_codon:yes stop_codon:yes gene_type:complete